MWLKNPDWKSSHSHYQVRIENEWVDVAEDALITAQQIRPDDGVADAGQQRTDDTMLLARQHDVIREGQKVCDGAAADAMQGPTVPKTKSPGQCRGVRSSAVCE